MYSVRSLVTTGTLALALGFASNHAHALGVPAGTVIDNTAAVTYTVGATSTTTSSNVVSVTVAEILDVVVTVQTPTVTVAPAATQQVMVYRVDNTGNGPETFRLVMNNAIGSDQFDPTAASPAIYLDTDASGTYTPGDAPYVVGNNDPVLAPDGTVNVFVINDIPAAVVDGNTGRTSLTADARTGNGAAGTIFAGQGQGGTDAVVGTTLALSQATGEYLVAAISMTVSKTQAVTGQFGTLPVPGARINYTITVSTSGSATATASGAVFNDNIPTNTTYVPGTLRLNGAALSDGTDVDVGEYLTSGPTPAVRVRLGNLTGTSSAQTVEFAVTIN